MQTGERFNDCTIVQTNKSNVQGCQPLPCALPDALSLFRIEFELVRAHPPINHFNAVEYPLQSSWSLCYCTVYVQLLVVCVTMDSHAK